MSTTAAGQPPQHSPQRMHAPGAYARLLELRRTRQEDSAWSLLCADNAALIMGTLGRHLAGEVRRIAAEDLIEAVEQDLDDLRSRGEELPQTARRYCADWRSNGWLIARPSSSSRGETFELSDGALRAIQIADSLTTPKSAVTESRLAAISGQLTDLSVDTDPDRSRQLATLTAQREALHQRIERIQRGEDPPIAMRDAVERLRDILTQAAELPSDFGRVRARFEELNATLRERVLESDASQKHVLDEMFRGVDLIGESDEGRSFAQFLRLVLDPEAGAALDDDVDQVLDRDFAEQLSPAERRFLRSFRALLKREGKDIQSSIAGFARGLRRYVQSQEFHRDRALRDQLRAALTEGLTAAPHTKPFRETDIELQLSGVPMAGVGALVLYDPGAMETAEDPQLIPDAEVSLEELRALARETEIDLDELRNNISTALAQHPEASIGDVLTAFPATQGVASVVGLLSLAMGAVPIGAAELVPMPGGAAPAEHGTCAEGVAPGGPPPAVGHSGCTEPVEWGALNGATHRADIPLYRFTRTPD